METIDQLKEKYPNDKDRIGDYLEFARNYDVADFDDFIKKYDITELKNALPEKPNSNQKSVFNSILGVEGNAVYLDYYRSNNSFELIMLFMEQNQNDMNDLNEKFGFTRD